MRVLLSFGWSIIVACSQCLSSFHSYQKTTETNIPTSGLALEAMSTILGKFTPFFMLTCILCTFPPDILPPCSEPNTSSAGNIAVCIYPIESMHDFYRYGYAAPLYNISLALRTIIFGTRNRGAVKFAILF